MIFLTKKKKNYIEWLIGCILYYISKLDDLQHDLSDAAKYITHLCFELGIDPLRASDEAKLYATERAFQKDGD